LASLAITSRNTEKVITRQRIYDVLAQGLSKYILVTLPGSAQTVPQFRIADSIRVCLHTGSCYAADSQSLLCSPSFEVRMSASKVRSTGIGAMFT